MGPSVRCGTGSKGLSQRLRSVDIGIDLVSLRPGILEDLDNMPDIAMDRIILVVKLSRLLAQTPSQGNKDLETELALETIQPTSQVDDLSLVPYCLCRTFNTVPYRDLLCIERYVAQEVYGS